MKIIALLIMISLPIHAMEPGKISLSTLENDFIQAAVDGKQVIVQKCLDEHVNANITNEHGESALYNAVFFKRWDIVDLLLDQPKIDVNIRSLTAHKKLSLIHLLCRRPSLREEAELSTSTLKRIIKREADINILNGYGETPLISAMRKGASWQFVDCLVQAGAKMTWDNNQESPLTLAIERGGACYAPFLLQSSNIALADIRQACDFCRRKDYLERFKVLQKYFTAMCELGYVHPNNSKWRASARIPFTNIPIQIAQKIAYYAAKESADAVFDPCSIV